jgi:alkylation response protein AidB-like acyl-CoA dehydrogenase
VNAAQRVATNPEGGDGDAPAELVLAEHRGPVLVLTFNRPAKLNAWTDELENRYFTLLDAAEDDPDVRAVVVTGAGRGFCAGADLQRLRSVGEVAEVAEVAGTDMARRRPRDLPLTLLMDTVGNKEARTEIAAIKVAAPNIALKIVDRAIQVHGAAGVTEDFPLAMMYAQLRTLRLADGPDEVHKRAIARRELRQYRDTAAAVAG